MLFTKIVGRDPNNPETDYELQIPAYLEFDASFSSKDPMDFHPQTEEKMKKEFRNTLSLRKFRDPHACHRYIDQDAEFINYILSSCPLPINQGPIIPAIDNDKSDLKGENLMQKVAWRHSEDQICAKWSPHSIKDDYLFPKYTIEPINCNDRIQGPCSDNSDMGIVYTCIKMHCRVKCPCKICFSKRTDCRRECGGFQCPKCTLQCPRHKVQMDRKFDQERHAFTLKGDKKDSAKFRVRRAGIPIDCIECVGFICNWRGSHI